MPDIIKHRLNINKQPNNMTTQPTSEPITYNCRRLQGEVAINNGQVLCGYREGSRNCALSHPPRECMGVSWYEKYQARQNKDPSHIALAQTSPKRTDLDFLKRELRAGPDFEPIDAIMDVIIGRPLRFPKR